MSARACQNLHKAVEGLMAAAVTSLLLRQASYSTWLLGVEGAMSALPAMAHVLHVTLHAEFALAPLLSYT